MLLLAAAVGLFAGGCGFDPPSATTLAAATPPSSADAVASCCAFAPGAVEIETDAGVVSFTVELARAEEERRRGLMFREQLAEDAGMLLVYEEPTRVGIWMKDTPLPLDVAFFDAGGRIVDIVELSPCEADPCPVYRPDLAYVGALEVNAGTLRRLGVAIGDRVSVVPQASRGDD
jgi:uncharacterized membrane protein (UPF0127 family)